ncbi:hypothetical protein [Streptomyces sp. NPDC005167]
MPGRPGARPPCGRRRGEGHCGGPVLDGRGAGGGGCLVEASAHIEYRGDGGREGTVGESAGAVGEEGGRGEVERAELRQLQGGQDGGHVGRPGRRVGGDEAVQDHRVAVGADVLGGGQSGGGRRRPAGGCHLGQVLGVQHRGRLDRLQHGRGSDGPAG